MKLLKNIGKHNIYTYDLNNFEFINFFKKIYKTNNLENLHLESTDYNKYIDKYDSYKLNDNDTDLHNIFYDKIKEDNEFKLLYCEFIQYIYKTFFKNEKYILYQSFPSIRIQYPQSIAIPPHKDSDSLSNHPLGEKNFVIPITQMKNTNSIYIETEPDNNHFININLDPGDLFYFDGNLCTHYNEKNIENKLRISLDFRIILIKDYNEYIKNWNLDIVNSNPRDILKKRDPSKMIVGGYYQITYLNEPFEKMMNWYKVKNIMQHRPTFEKEEAEEVYKYMCEDNFITEHKKTEELEKIICTYLNCDHCIMTTSGTTSIMLALMALNLKEDDEVIVPNYTMIATINSVKMLKLKPIIIDVDINTCTLDLEEIKKYVNKNTKCILHVSLNNRYKDMNQLVNYCKENNLYLVEDAAQSLGCKINGKNLGTFGDLGCFSLSTPKIISTGQGGFVVTNNDKLANIIRMMKNFGRRESGIDDFVVFGINLKFTDIQAVIGIEQMKKLDYRVIRLREIYHLYYYELKDTVDIKVPLSEEWIPWFVDIYIESREELMKYLKKHKITTRPVYGEINKTPVYYEDNTLKNSNYICNYGLFLPSYITLKNEDIIYICNVIKLFYNNN
jgi:perosamine synthetase